MFLICWWVSSSVDTKRGKSLPIPVVTWFSQSCTEFEKNIQQPPDKLTSHLTSIAQQNSERSFKKLNCNTVQGKSPKHG